MSGSGSGTQSIDRAAQLLSLVVLADRRPLFGDLVAGTGLAKSTASRLLQALERHRLLHRDDTGSYAPGPLFALYAARHEPLEGLMRIAQPTLARVSQATGETVNLAVVRGNTVVQVAQIDSTYLIGTTNWVDVDVPPHCSALGKVFSAAEMIGLPTTLEQLTPSTITDLPAFKRQLERIRDQGYAVALGELEIGLDAIAAPVRDHTGDVVAALGISGPSDRFGKQLPHLESTVIAHARSLSAELGYHARKEGAA
ncbi:MAG: IclR family transcriptional regulator [Nocardioidaceae bacterium]